MSRRPKDHPFVPLSKTYKVQKGTSPQVVVEWVLKNLELDKYNYQITLGKVADGKGG